MVVVVVLKEGAQKERMGKCERKKKRKEREGEKGGGGVRRWDEQEGLERGGERKHE